MKKLLALILCVMLFVAVMPTSAFAAATYVDEDDDPLLKARVYADET